MSADLYHPYPVSNGGGGQAIRSPGAVSVGWVITGYIAPTQDQFPNTADVTVHVSDAGRGIAGTFVMSSGFIDSTFRNGTGSCSGGRANPNGWYLAFISWNQGGAVASGISVSGPAGADGYFSIPSNTIATDHTSGGLPFGTEIKIPTLVVSPWNGYRFASHDLGSFPGLHVDIATGEGSGAGLLANQLTVLAPALGSKVIKYYKPAGKDPPPISGQL